MIALSNSQPASSYMQEKSYVEQALEKATTAKEALMVVVHALDHLCTTFACVKEHSGEILIDYADYAKRKKALFVTQMPTINTPLDSNATEVVYELMARVHGYLAKWEESEAFRTDFFIAGELKLLANRYTTMASSILGNCVMDFPFHGALSVRVARAIDWAKSDVKTYFTVQPQSDKKLQYVYVFEE